MTYILTCGCKSEYGGFPCEWDSETRECEPAVAYGSLCEKHYAEYGARPAQYEEPQQFFNKVRDISVALDKGTYCNGFCGVEECKENQANCKRLASQTKPLRFPTMLRKMWTGAEVQEWLDKNQGIK